MSYSEDGEKIILAMTSDDYARLLLMLGVAIGAETRRGDARIFYERVAFVNRLNAGNPDFTPYEIPVEYREESQ